VRLFGPCNLGELGGIANPGLDATDRHSSICTPTVTHSESVDRVRQIPSPAVRADRVDPVPSRQSVAGHFAALGHGNDQVRVFICLLVSRPPGERMCPGVVP